jgi:Tfp pilus assembly protein PilX
MRHFGLFAQVKSTTSAFWSCRLNLHCARSGKKIRRSLLISVHSICLYLHPKKKGKKKERERERESESNVESGSNLKALRRSSILFPFFFFSILAAASSRAFALEVTLQSYFQILFLSREDLLFFYFHSWLRAETEASRRS